MSYKILFVILLLSTSSFAQNRASTCYFGTAALDFRSFPPQAITNSGMDSREAAASICNEQGDILFYTNGGDSPLNASVFGGVWNANNQLMENGDLSGLGGCMSSYYGATILPIDTSLHKVGDNTLYYLITNDCIESSISGNQFNAGIRYSVIDMSYNNGLGKVIAKDQIVLPFSSTGKLATALEPIAAISKIVDNDYWLFGYHNDSLFSMTFGYNSMGDYRSYFKSERKITISPNGNYLVTDDKLFALNRSNADLQLMFSIQTNICAFSSNGNVLYALEGSTVYQYNLENPNPESTKTLVATGNLGNELILGPDNRIYFFSSNASNLPGCIHCPNNLGDACGVDYQPISLGGKNARNYFTNIPANLLYNDGLNCIADVNEIDLNSFSIVPNPTVDQVSISSDKQLRKVEIYNLSGKLIYTKETQMNSFNFDFKKYESGVYLIKAICTDGEIYISRIQKQ